jgi:hypothetical protein
MIGKHMSFLSSKWRHWWSRSVCDRSLTLLAAATALSPGGCRRCGRGGHALLCHDA